jgi:hypothetical protein
MARKLTEEMIGEGLRDVGILILVFAVLDKLVNGQITLWWTLAAVSVSALVFASGCYVERIRPDE